MGWNNIKDNEQSTLLAPDFMKFSLTLLSLVVTKRSHTLKQTAGLFKYV